MDDIVKQAMAKWPNVPACAGWLGLGARGDWYLRDAAAQAAGPFAGAGSSAASRGSRVEMEKLRDAFPAHTDRLIRAIARVEASHDLLQSAGKAHARVDLGREIERQRRMYGSDAVH